MKKYMLDLTVVGVRQISRKHALIRLTDEQELPEMIPGQFVEVRIDDSPSTFLRRPISINFIDREHNELWLLVAMIGDGTRRLGQLQTGDKLNCLLPLGNAFTMPENNGPLLLVGGGVGVAPLLYMGAEMLKQGLRPTFLLGARTKEDLLEVDLFNRYGRVCVTTEDGSAGEQGFVTAHSILQQEHFQRIYTCGPKPMMMAVARYARNAGIVCEASLENMMACGLGACLCCVEKVKVDDGSPDFASSSQMSNVCVCKDGPVFDTRCLLWT